MTACAAVRADEIVGEVARIKGCACRGCGRPVCGHEALVAVVMGFSRAPRCLPCTAMPLSTNATELLEDAYAHVVRRDCYLAGWRWASDNEPDDCAWAHPRADHVDPGARVRPEERMSVAETFVASWDAGGTACGELVLELRSRLATLAAGALFDLTAHDPGAREDIPAWCAMTRHTLVRAAHPVYVIRVREATPAARARRHRT